MSRFQKAFRATVVDSGFGYASQALSFFSLPLFLDTLGAEGYGLMVTVLAFTGYLNFADAGLSWGSMVLISHAHGQQDKEKIAHITRHSAILAAASGLVALLFLGSVLGASALGWRLPMFARHPESDPLILIAGLQLILTLQFGIFFNVFKGLQETYWTAFYQGLGRLLGLAASMVAAWMTRSVEAVMIVQLIFATAAGVAASIHVWRRHPWAFKRGSWTDWDQYNLQIRVGGKNFLIQIGQTLANTAPTFAISSILGPAFVPLYTVPVTLLSLFFTPINSWTSSMQNAYGEAWSSGAAEWTRNAFRKTLEQIVLVAGFGTALFLLYSDAFIQLWTHGRLSLVPWMGLSVAAFLVTNTLVKAAEYLLIGLNRHRNAAVAEMANGLIAMLLVPLSVRWLGIGAVGVGSMIALVSTCVWVLIREVRRQLGKGAFPSVNYLIRVLIALAATVALGRFVPSASGAATSATLVRVALAATAGCALFLAIAVALRLVPSVKALLRRPVIQAPVGPSP